MSAAAAASYAISRLSTAFVCRDVIRRRFIAHNTAKYGDASNFTMTSLNPHVCCTQLHLFV